ncbi:MAG: tail fiber domain-containing protein [Muribaculaceae bacterium]|nr:tail fiber domain-containing protein [Muribaculaceae bacterium]
MKHLKSLLSLAVVLLPLSLYSQVKYSGGRLSINTQDNSIYDLRINEWPKMYWYNNYYRDKKFFSIDVSPRNPRIYGTGDMIYFFNVETKKYNSIKVAHVHDVSDARSKRDIHSLSSGLSTLLQLRPVSYHWIDEEVSAMATDKSSITKIIATTDKERQYGFLAQEVEQVLPEIVRSDSTGGKSVNYLALIPLMVQSVQELYSEAADNSAALDQLVNGRPSQSTANINNKIVGCSPNPTTGFVTISTQLEESVTEAKIAITGVDGSIAKVLTVSHQAPTVTTDMSLFQQGVYIVSLYINDNQVDYCRLIKN